MKPASEGKGPVRGPNDATKVLGLVIEEMTGWRDQPLNAEQLHAIVDTVVILVEWNALNFDAAFAAAPRQEPTLDSAEPNAPSGDGPGGR